MFCENSILYYTTDELYIICKCTAPMLYTHNYNAETIYRALLLLYLCRVYMILMSAKNAFSHGFSRFVFKHRIADDLPSCTCRDPKTTAKTIYSIYRIPSVKFKSNLSSGIRTNHHALLYRRPCTRARRLKIIVRVWRDWAHHVVVIFSMVL